MKKLIYMAILGIAFAGCDGGKSAEEEARLEEKRVADSIRTADSLAAVALEAARLDSLRQDSISKVEKFIAAIPSFNQVNNGDAAKLFKRLGYNVTMKKGYDEFDGSSFTYAAKASYILSDNMKVVYAPTNGGFEITITGAPEQRDRFLADAKAYIAKCKRDNPMDPWANEWYAKMNGDKITLYMMGD